MKKLKPRVMFGKGTLLPSALTKDVEEPQAMQLHDSATVGPREHLDLNPPQLPGCAENPPGGCIYQDSLV